jgi:hypothetical protein
VPIREPRDKDLEVTGPTTAGTPFAAAARTNSNASGSSTGANRSASSGSSSGSGATSTSRACSQSGGVACCDARGGGGEGASDSEGLSAAPRPSAPAPAAPAPAAPAPLLDVTSHPVRLEQLGASLRAAAAQLSEPALAAVEQQVRGNTQAGALAGCLF